MPFGSKIKTNKKKMERRERFYKQKIRRGEGTSPKELEGHTFLCSTQFNCGFLRTALWHESSGLDPVPVPIIILIRQSINT